MTINDAIGTRKFGNVTQPEDQLTRSVEMQTRNIPSLFFLGLAGASIAGSLVLKFLERDTDALFVGQWAPTFLLLGVYNKIVKEEGR